MTGRGSIFILQRLTHINLTLYPTLDKTPNFQYFVHFSTTFSGWQLHRHLSSVVRMTETDDGSRNVGLFAVQISNAAASPRVLVNSVAVKGLDYLHPLVVYNGGGSILICITVRNSSVL